MKYIWHDSPRAFLDALQAKVDDDIVNYSYIAGNAAGALERTVEPKAVLLLLTIEDGDRLLGAAYMSPPRKLFLQCPADIAPNVAREIHEHGWTVPSAHVNGKAAQTFAEAWSGLTGHLPRRGMSEGLLVLRQVRRLTYSPGLARAALPENTDLLVEWQTKFQREALPDEPMTDDAIRGLIAEGINAKSRYLWEDGQPVSMALVRRRALAGMEITDVYTPPEYRRRGYATSCVARLSEKCLADGASYCFLFSDLANPTSNSIYEKIGYKPTCTFQNYDHEDDCHVATV